MSIYKLRNETGSEQVDVKFGSNLFTFPVNALIDLVDTIGLESNDIIGSLGGEAYEDIASLIRTGNWFLNDGDNDYLKEQALHVLKYGTPLLNNHVKRESHTLVSHDFANKSTWSQTATQVTGKILTKVKTGSLSYSSNEVDGCWVNLENGLVYQENKLISLVDKNVKIYVNNVLTDPKNYSINHMYKTVTFKDTFVIPANAVIKADYWLTKDSFWEILLDKKMITRIVKSEVQFNRNIKLSKKLSMELIADHPLMTTPYVLNSWDYKGIRDYMSGSSNGFTLPSFGGTSEQSGYLEDTITLKFDYITPLELPTNKYIESIGLSNPRMRCYVDGHKEVEGLYTTVTFYLDTAEL